MSYSIRNLWLLSLQFKEQAARLKKSSFLKNVAILMTGTAAAQAIGFALIPIISRLFTPSDFGIYGSFDAILTVVAAGVTLDYSQAIVLPKEKKDAINVFAISCVSAGTISILCLAACLIIPDFLHDALRVPNPWVPHLLVLAVLVTGLNQSCHAWCVRAKAFQTTSASQVIRSLSTSGAQIGFGYVKGGGIALIVSSILGEIFALLNLLRVVYRNLWPSRREIAISSMKRLARDYLDFPMYSASMNVMNALSTGLPVLLLSHFYGLATAGAYAFGVRILSAPMRLVLSALRQVLFQKAAETSNVGDPLMPLYVKITGGLFALGILPALVFFLWSPLLFTWIFGSQWQTAGEFASYLTLWLFFAFCNLPAVLFARVIRIQRKIFFYELLLLATRTLALALGGMYLPSFQTVMLFSAVGAFLNLSLIVVVGYTLSINERRHLIL